MRFLKAMFGSKGHKERVEALQRALDKRNESVAVLKTRVDKLSQANGLLREENARLKSKVTELYDRNKDYAQRLRGDR